MIVKERGKDHHIKGLQALLRRMSESHPKFEVITQQVAKMTAGIRGEERLTKIFLDYTFLEDVYIIHDLSFYSTGHCQIDTLVITSGFGLILESKNIAGDMHFLNETNQIARKLDTGKIDNFESPMAQVERNRDLLEDWLKLRGVELAIYGAVVLPKATQKVEISGKSYPVLFPGEIPSFIKRLIKKHSGVVSVDGEGIAHSLAAAHQEFNPFPICERWGIEPESLKKGVFCPKCTIGMMNRRNRKWICDSCNHKDSFAHQQAIREWFMLIGGNLTNQKCRDFLNMPSHQWASREMAKMEMEVDGKGRHTKYRMKS